MRTTIALAIALALTIPPAASAARPDAWVDRFAHNAMTATADGNCVALPVNEVCGYRARLITRAVELDGTVEDCDRWSRACAYTLEGRTRRVAFFCTGTLTTGRRIRADQAVDCYGDDDPTWSEGDDGVVIRTPGAGR